LDARILAATGFQTGGIDKNLLNMFFKDALSSDNKLIEYIQTSIRSAKDLYVHGGHVTKTYADRSFRLEYDNKRVINLPENLKDKTDFSDILLDSEPVVNVNQAINMRNFARFYKNSHYNKYLTKPGGTKYKKLNELAIRNFVKGLLSNPPKFNLDNKFSSYGEIIDYIREFDNTYKMTKSGLSKLKGRKIIVKTVPKTDETLTFVNYVKIKFPNFDTDEFFR